MQKSVNSRSSQMNELKEKFLQLQELEEALDEIFQMESHRAHKLPKRMQDKPKTIHHPEVSPIISDDIL